MDDFHKTTALRLILDRIKKVEGAKNDTDLAVPLRVTKRNIANWKSRNSIPWETLVAYCRWRKVSMEWLFNDRGPMMNDVIAEPGVLYQVETNQDAVYDIAAEVYQTLLDQQKQPTPDKYRQLVKLLHRETIETGQSPSAEKINELIMLI